MHGILRLAIAGNGGAGLFAARRLHSNHDVTVFEADGRIRDGLAARGSEDRFRRLREFDIFYREDGFLEPAIGAAQPVYATPGALPVPTASAEAA
jgi:glycine/D-amino acid oxidase-like deaminating enzyme